MKFLLLLAGLCHLSLVIGSPEAEAEAQPDETSPEPLAMSSENDMSLFQSGGPGSSSSSYSYSYSSKSPSVSSYSYSSRSPVMRSASSFSYGSQGYQSGNAGEYTKPWPAAAQASSASMESFQADSYGAYGSISMPTTGNVQPDMGFDSRPDTNYPLMPSGGGGRPNTYYPLMPSEGSRPNTNLPLLPFNNRQNYMPLNNQGNMYTRAYTPLSNGCTNVCSMRRPMFGIRPSCTNTCSPIRSPCNQGVTWGNTRLCNPRPPMNPLPCGRGWNGGNGGRCPSVIRPVPLPQPSPPCQTGGCSWPPMQWRQPNPCPGGSCSWSRPQPVQTWPMQPSPWTPPQQAAPCSSGGCSETQPQYPIWNNVQASAPRAPIPEGWNTAGGEAPVDPIPDVNAVEAG